MRYHYYYHLLCPSISISPPCVPLNSILKCLGFTLSKPVLNLSAGVLYDICANKREQVVSDAEMVELFGVIDVDQSGAIDAAELQELLSSDLAIHSMTFEPFYAALYHLQHQHP